ncbi:MAG: universal stress protein [Thermoplasmata archaeon]|jgi:nucleotide-binding universal stress UspA family protein|nr:universal stress protein [Thermoplasmata archaeon]
MYRRILVPVAEPNEVEPMIRFAASLLDTDGEIRVLHIIPTTTLPEVAREWRASVNIVIPAHEAGAALDVRVEPEVRAATDVSGEILEAAETEGVDAIILTLKGNRASRNPFVGRTASGILHHARSDVLILNRLALAADHVPRILVPTFQATPPPKAMRIAEEISVRRGGVPVITLGLGPRVAGGGVEATREEQSPRGVPFVHKRSFFPESRLGRRSRLAELLLRAAQRERYGLLLVGGEEEGSQGPLLTRRFLEELFRAAPCPVVAVRV